MSIEDIQNCEDDELLYKRLAEELTELAGDSDPEEVDEWLPETRSFPRSLWALASIYELDVSIHLDDLGWHFASHYHWESQQETLKALKVIGAEEVAAVFEEALKVLNRHWLILGKIVSHKHIDFTDWYPESQLYDELSPFNRRMWELKDEAGLLDRLVQYVRANPSAALKPLDA